MVESIEGGHPLGRCPPASGRDLRIALGACALVLGETGLDPRIDTSLAKTGRVDSVRVPPLAGELVVTDRGHAISLVVLVTTRGLVDDFLPLTVRGRRRKDGEPDESSRRVWRQ